MEEGESSDMAVVSKWYPTIRNFGQAKSSLNDDVFKIITSHRKYMIKCTHFSERAVMNKMAFDLFDLNYFCLEFRLWFYFSLHY